MVFYVFLLPTNHIKGVTINNKWTLLTITSLLHVVRVSSVLSSSIVIQKWVCFESVPLKIISIYCPDVVNVMLANNPNPLNAVIQTNCYYFTAFTIETGHRAIIKVKNTIFDKPFASAFNHLLFDSVSHRERWRCELILKTWTRIHFNLKVKRTCNVG